MRRSDYGAFRSIFPCLPSAGFYTTRVLMLIGPLSLPSLTTAGRLLRWSVSARAIAERDHQEVDGLNLSVDGEGADWVTEPKGAIKKANLTFMAKFLWLIVCHCLSPTTADNIVT